MEEEDAHDVLRDVVNEDPRDSEDEDFALAKMMQEQERAFYQARNFYRYGENEGEGPDYGLLRPHTEQFYQALESEARSLDAPEGLPQLEEGAPELAEDDELMARRLHLQEQLEHQRRLLELAGIAPEGESYSDEDEEYLTDDSVDPDEMTYEELRALGDAVGVVSRGASVDIIEALPFARYAGHGKLEALSGGSTPTEESAACQDEQCVVCRMEFEGGEDVKVLPCKHVFHPECINQWLLINKACPICASEVTTLGEQPARDKPGLKHSKT